ncbi:MAG: DUF494 domain-containing protein [Methylococcales bacterium]
MFEVLVYMFENYFEMDIRPDHGTLSRELFAAGFEQEDINSAFDWYTVLEEMSSKPDVVLIDHKHSYRIYSEIESAKLSTDSLGLLMFLEQAQILNATQRELIVDRAMALPQSEVDVEETRWIVLITLWNQGKVNDYLFVEDAVFGEVNSTLH